MRGSKSLSTLMGSGKQRSSLLVKNTVDVGGAKSAALPETIPAAFRIAEIIEEIEKTPFPQKLRIEALSDVTETGAIVRPKVRTLAAQRGVAQKEKIAPSSIVKNRFIFLLS